LVGLRQLLAETGQKEVNQGHSTTSNQSKKKEKKDRMGGLICAPGTPAGIRQLMRALGHLTRPGYKYPHLNP